ncbi:MAG TPA: S8 family serine peptidase [Anaerolineales bacterium]|nr:S8 family serine peptidase [Anaerolineales bacterium]
MYRKVFVVLSFVLILAVAFSAVSPVAAKPDHKFKGGGPVQESPNGIYIVQMINDPVVAYEGDVPGFAATKPAKGQKINPNSNDVKKYAGYLRGRHDEALRGVGGQKLYDYVYSFNGFAAKMSLEQANKLALANGVVLVSPDEALTLDTSSTPAFLGLSSPGGLWDQLGGIGSAGEGVIIGIVDGGVWPESLSFADRVDNNGVPSFAPSARRAYQQIPGWHGRCVPGEQFNASMCNQKLIGAQYYNAAWGGNAGIDAQLPHEYNSPRDFGGHGTHTSSTAGGNYGVPATGAAAVFGSTSGIAPRARIASYKVCWQTPAGGSCFSSDSVAAIDQAVADGVDVINFSISGSRTNFLDPVEVAFLFAADAGVFVAASAGNSGPAVSTVAHPGPWLTTVAAGTHNRDGQGSVTLGNGATYNGASVATPVSAPLIDSTAAGVSGADPNQLALCYGAADGAVVLDPAKVAGKIVVCDRGVTARVNKSLAVQQAGGVGMILVNTSPNSINADLHFVSTVHLDSPHRPAIKAYAATAGATATINQSTVVTNAAAPFTAAFSSRGPLLAGNGDLLKPDVIAPGQDVLASVAPPGNFGRDFDLYSGTSMSSPHVAGLAALLKHLRPDWSPMAIKSALMTSAYDVLDGSNTNPTVIFRQGAGHVQPNSAADPGLVYDHSFLDWLAFLCGTTTGVNPATCTTLSGLGYSSDPSNLNVASIALGDLAGQQTVTRKVTNVGSGAATYTASVTGLSGVNVSVSPSSLTLSPGQTGTFTVTFITAGATLNSYVGGYLTWSDGSHNVRIPMVVRPVVLAAPVQVSSNGDPINYNVTFGYTGPFTATARGLIPASVTPGTVNQDPDQTFAQNDPTGTVAIPVTIPAGSTYVRFSLFDADVSTGTDLDLYVYQGSTLVGASTSGTSAEEVNFTFANPTGAPIALTAYVHGWGVAGGTSPFKLHFWALGTANAGNMTVTAPATATQGSTGTINLTFSGLAPATRYLGSVVYAGAAGMPSPTIVRVDTP